MRSYTFAILAIAVALQFGEHSFAAPPAGIDFRLYRDGLDVAIFRFANNSKGVITLPGAYAQTTGASYHPTGAELQKLNRAKWSRVGIVDPGIPLEWPYRLAANEVVYFRLERWGEYDFSGASSGRIKVGEYFSKPFPVKPTLPNQLRLSLREGDGDSAAGIAGREQDRLWFKMLNDGERDVELPTAGSPDDIDAAFKLSEFEVQSSSNGRWRSLRKVELGDSYIGRMKAKETYFFPIAKEQLGAPKKGQLLRIKVGPFTSKPFQAPR